MARGAPGASWLDLRLGDALTVLRTLPEQSVNCVVTSPPYWALRDYDVDGQIGLEDTVPEYKPIVLTGEQALHAAYYIVQYLRNGVSPELFFDATGIEARELVEGPLGRVVRLS